MREAAVGTIARQAEGLLKVRQIRFHYSSQATVRQDGERGFEIGPMDLAVRPGEVLSVCGPNGSGKTTLLSLLGGWRKPQTGEVLLGGGEASRLTARERARRVAFVSQESPLLFPMTVAQFVLLGRYAYLGGTGFESAADWEAAQESLRRLTLLELASQRMDRISGGEKQRAILARALAQQPELLLLDEPTANLDLNFQVEFLALVRSLAQKEKLAVVVVLHDLNLAAEFSDRVLLLRRGKALRLGTPEEVFQQPLLESTYGLRLLVDRNPVSGRPRISIAARTSGSGDR